ncbi:hypothetical protein [Bosea sp. Leaf344]|nr:hypothetical protein [Bosea sp. Leaf344]
MTNYLEFTYMHPASSKMKTIHTALKRIDGRQERGSAPGDELHPC